MEIHPDLAEFRALLGEWHGQGQGRYPTIEDFGYHEEITFVPGPGKPFIAYTQRTRRLGTGEPLHTETGYLRPAGAGRTEMVIVSPTGILEMHTGSVSPSHVHLRSAWVECTPTAKEVKDVERHIEIDGDDLRYRLSMAAMGQHLQTHLEATLHRVRSPFG